MNIEKQPDQAPAALPKRRNTAPSVFNLQPLAFLI
jgi:hypothetical protein